MANFRTLKGLVNSLADTFVSRNNDVSGYWALGMLYREALERSDEMYEIELYPISNSLAGRVASAVGDFYREKLGDWAISRGVKLIRAVVTANFGSHSRPVRRAWNDFGEPFELRFCLVDSAGHEAVATRFGWCRPHDPEKESRSTRWHDD